MPLGNTPHYKKAKPNIIKSLLFLGLGLWLGWGVCHYYVEYYGGVFPNDSIYGFIIDHKWVVIGFLTALPSITSFL